MEKNKATTKPRGGLAAEAESTPKPAKAKKAAASNKPTIMGFPVRAVIRRLGKAGCTSGHVAAILEKHGITVPAGAIPNEIKRGKLLLEGALAELTGAQVKELKDSATAPADAPKATKVPKAKKEKSAKPAKAKKAKKSAADPEAAPLEIASSSTAADDHPPA